MNKVNVQAFPHRFASLPVDERGYPVPWFVIREDGTYDFRVMEARKFSRAIRERVCWVCGQPLGRWLAFGIGPMCAITRTISEPPSHLECMSWSIRNCPFLSNPKQGRDTAAIPEGAVEASGFPLTRNPGVMCLWMTKTYDVFNPPNKQPNQPPLIHIGEAESTSWWREGRHATRGEVDEAIAGGMPALLAMAQLQGDFAVTQLGFAYKKVQELLPGGTDR